VFLEQLTNAVQSLLCGQHQELRPREAAVFRRRVAVARQRPCQACVRGVAQCESCPQHPLFQHFQASNNFAGLDTGCWQTRRLPVRDKHRSNATGVGSTAAPSKGAVAVLQGHETVLYWPHGAPSAVYPLGTSQVSVTHRRSGQQSGKESSRGAAASRRSLSRCG